MMDGPAGRPACLVGGGRHNMNAGSPEVGPPNNEPCLQKRVSGK